MHICVDTCLHIHAIYDILLLYNYACVGVYFTWCRPAVNDLYWEERIDPKTGTFYSVNLRDDRKKEGTSSTSASNTTTSNRKSSPIRLSVILIMPFFDLDRPFSLEQTFNYASYLKRFLVLLIKLSIIIQFFPFLFIVLCNTGSEAAIMAESTRSMLQ